MIYEKTFGGNGVHHNFVASEQEMRMLEAMPEGIYFGIVGKCVEAWLEKNKESVLAGVSLDIVIDRAMTAAGDALKEEVLRVSKEKMGIDDSSKQTV